jgi:hypothetical protein
MKLQYITGCTYNDLHIDYANADMFTGEVKLKKKDK